MSAAKSIHAHGDCREALDAALVSERGIRIRLESHGKAVSFRQRAYSLRSSDRRQAASMYDPGHPAYGTSVYDVLYIEIEGDAVLIKKHEQGKLKIEEL